MQMRPANLLSRSTEHTIWCQRRISSCGTSSPITFLTGHAWRTQMNLEKIKSDIEAAVPGCSLKLILNCSPSGQHSLLLDREHAVEVAKFLRVDAELHLDYCSNVTAVDWLDVENSEK